MSKVIIMQGLPGSGKTYYAKQYQKEHLGTKRVNRDELRAMFDDSVWSKENEKFVVEMQNFLITMALMEDYDIIVDDTNLAEKNIKRITDLVEQHNDVTCACNKKHEATVEIVKMTTSLDECIRRDAERTGKAKVGEEVIRRFWRDHYDTANTKN